MIYDSDMKIALKKLAKDNKDHKVDYTFYEVAGLIEDAGVFNRMELVG